MRVSLFPTVVHIMWISPGAKGIDRAVVWIMARRPAKQVVKLSGKKSNAKNVKFPSAGSFGYRMAA